MEQESLPIFSICFPDSCSNVVPQQWKNFPLSTGSVLADQLPPTTAALCQEACESERLLTGLQSSGFYLVMQLWANNYMKR